MDSPTVTEKPEKYSEDELPEYSPMPWKIQDIRAAIPDRLFVRDTKRGLAWLGLDLAMAACCWKLALHIDPTFVSRTTVERLTVPGAEAARWACWLLYWWFQGLIFTGVWVIGHECGHGAFSPSRSVCHVVGFVTHTLLWTPYFSWKISHHRHHCNHASMERDEVYVPKTRSDLGIPQEGTRKIDYDEYLGDTPIYTLYMLVRQQVLAFPAYLLFNVSGQKSYPKWTNHFDPSSILFSREQRNAVLISNFGILVMIALVRQACAVWGAAAVLTFYGIPWLCVTHWFIMITYLHHTDPALPHYRQREWNFARGAAATVDRDFLGWMGRFFLHDVAHFHVVHHFFPKMPFYHGPEATGYLRAFIGEHYHRSDKPVFRALWDNYNDCQFVEDSGDVLFYRDRKGRAALRPAAPYRAGTAGPAAATSAL
ncbi:linoleoyl phosphatidylcholine delta-12 acetylenase [Trametes elegans]|nr:linoleoyl phosphatidylcholine delta-12 acetylenase [Trametes elegans]